MLTAKDYITLTLSALALGLSLYNYYESRKETRAARVRTIERKRFEGSVILSAITACKMRTEAALQAVRFDAQMTANPQIVESIDKRLTSVRESIAQFSKEREEQARMLAKPIKKGSLEALLAAEQFVGRMKNCQALVNEAEVIDENFIAEVRRHLLAVTGVDQA